MIKNVGVLIGGESFSAESSVSFMTGEAVILSLERLGYKVSKIEINNNFYKNISLISQMDVIFNALHGAYGEDGCIQGLLELLRVPYTHSGVLASSIAMNKERSRNIFKAAGLPVIQGKTFKRLDLNTNDPLKRPYVIKPISGGSSIGVEIVTESSGLPASCCSGFPEDLLLAEKFIPGKEITVAVKGGEPLGVLEIETLNGFYDFQNKYESEKTNYIFPPRIPKETILKSLEIAETAHKVIGCRGITRVDMRCDLSSEIFVLEINTQPGLTSKSLVPRIASNVGITFDSLIDWMVNEARCENDDVELV